MSSRTNGMRPLVGGPGLALALLLAAGCGSGGEEVVSAEGGFKARFPGSRGVRTESGPGAPRAVNLVQMTLRSGTCTVSWEDLSLEGDVSDQERLNLACTGALDRLKARARSRRPVRLGDRYPGLEFIADSGDGKLMIQDRLYLVKRRLYNVLVIGEPWWVESSEAQAFLSSFALKEAGEGG